MNVWNVLAILAVAGLAQLAAVTTWKWTWKRAIRWAYKKVDSGHDQDRFVPKCDMFVASYFVWSIANVAFCSATQKDTPAWLTALASIAFVGLIICLACKDGLTDKLNSELWEGAYNLHAAELKSLSRRGYISPRDATVRYEFHQRVYFLIGGQQAQYGVPEFIDQILDGRRHGIPIPSTLIVVDSQRGTSISGTGWHMEWPQGDDSRTTLILMDCRRKRHTINNLKPNDFTPVLEFINKFRTVDEYLADREARLAMVAMQESIDAMETSRSTKLSPALKDAKAPLQAWLDRHKPAIVPAIDADQAA